MRGTLRFKNGAWRLQVYAGIVDGHEKRIQRTVRAPDTRDGRKRAERALAELVLDTEAGRALREHDLTVAELVDRWIRTRRDDWSPSTARNARLALDRYIGPQIGPTPAYRLRGHDLDALYRRLLDDGLAPSSVRRVHAVLHSAFAQGVKWEVIATNPVDAATPPKAKKATVQPPTPAELARALTAVEDVPALAAFFRLAASTGARRGTLCALRWSDIDLEARAVTFARAIAIGTDGHHERGTKTGQIHKVALDTATVTALQRHRRARVEAALAAGEPLADGSFVFARDVAGEQHWRPDFVTYRWGKLRTDTGIDPRIRFHDVRHFVATQLLAAGEDPVTVAGRLGHANANVTMAVYAHFLPERDRQAADTIAAIIDQTGAG